MLLGPQKVEVSGAFKKGSNIHVRTYMLRIEHPYNCPSRIHKGIIDETRGRSPRDHLLFLSVSLRWTAIGVFYATCILAIHSLSERKSSGASRAETVEPNSDDASWHGHEKKNKSWAAPSD